MSASRPNIIFVTSDQQRFDGISMLSPGLRTPHLARLAREGLHLERSYTCSPLCTPARASWLTGQHPSRHGAWCVGTLLDPDCLSVAALLGTAGYRTTMIGKSHLQPCLEQEGRSLEGPRRAFDTAHFRAWHGPWYGFEHVEINVGHADEPHSASMHYRAWLEDRGVDIAAHFGVEPYPSLAAWLLPERYHPCSWISERAVAYLEERARRRDGPFFANINFPEPHPPMHVPEPWSSMYAGAAVPPPIRRWQEWHSSSAMHRAIIEQRLHELGWHDRFPIANLSAPAEVLADGPATAGTFTPYEADRMRVYWGMISLLDHHLGMILDALDRLGLAEDTLVVFTSDHGDLMGDHYMVGKGSCHYRGVVQVPTVVRWPSTLRGGQRLGALTSGVDWAPTFLAAAGLPGHPAMQGVDQLPVWRGERERSRDGVWIDFRSERGLYVNSWITEGHRLSLYHRKDSVDEAELFDLARDPDEYDNIAHDPKGAVLAARMAYALLRESTTRARDWQERLAFA